MTTTMIPQVIQTCFRLIRRLQQKNRFVSLDLGTELSIVQTMILLEISTGVNAMNALIAIFKLDQSTISRHVSALIKKKFIVSAKVKKDARQKILTVTEQGQRFLARYNAESNKIVDGFLRLLSAEEAKDIEMFFKTIADKLNAPTLKLTTLDHPIRREMRRLTHALSILSQSFMGSDLTVGAWQVLSEVVYFPQRNSQVIISNAFGMSLPTISSMVARLERDGLVHLSASNQDARVTTITVTEKGKQQATAIEHEYCKMLELGCTDITKSSLEKYVEIFARFIGETAEGDVYVDRTRVLKIVRDDEALRELRVSLVKKLLDPEIVSHPPIVLLHPDNVCWVVESNNKVLAIGEFATRADGIECVNAVFYEEIKNKDKAKLLNDVALIAIEQEPKTRRYVRGGSYLAMQGIEFAA